jgi:hypothetical protein
MKLDATKILPLIPYTNIPTRYYLEELSFGLGCDLDKIGYNLNQIVVNSCIMLILVKLRRSYGQILDLTV